MPRKKKQKRTTEMKKMKDFLFGHKDGESRFKMMEERIERAKLLKVLYYHSDEKIQNLCDHICDPLFDNTSIVSLCKRVGLTLKDLTKAFKEVQMDIGLIQMYDHVPQIMEDVANDAKSKMVFCKRCDGTGKVPDETLPNGTEETLEEDERVESLLKSRDCPACKGVGEVMQSGDSDARKLVFESVGLTSKRGPMVAIQNNNSFEGADTLEELIGRVNQPQLPKPEPETLPAVVVPAEEVARES